MPEEPTLDPNPPIVKWTKKDGVLEKETTHAKPKVHKESFDVAQAQGRIDKHMAIAQMWVDKCIPDQELIDRYNEL